MTQITGIGASSGIAIAKAYRLQAPALSFDEKEINHPDEEIERLNKALDISKQELEKIRENTKENIGEEQAEIFSAHLLVLSDPELIDPMKEKIKTDQAMAEAALQEVADMFINMFKD